MKNLDQRLDEALAGLPSDDIPTSGEQTMNSIEIITWSNTQDGDLSLLKNNPNVQGPGISYIVFGQGDFNLDSEHTTPLEQKILYQTKIYLGITKRS